MVNIILAYAFFYFSSTTLLEERSYQQMASVRTLTSHKLELYLSGLKDFSRQYASRVLRPEFQLTSELTSKELRGLSVWQEGKLQTTFLGNLEADKLPLLTNNFYPIGQDEFAIKITLNDRDVVFVYSEEGINKLLEEREGLGESGEIYLVAQGKIRSASRHLKDWQGVEVKNASITQAGLKQTGVHKTQDYRGVTVVSAFAPFDYDELDFILLSEIDSDEVLSPLRSLFPRIFLICGIVCTLTLLLAYLSSRKILQMVDRMKEEINRVHIRFINAMEVEKKKMAYNLHDGVGQILTALKWGISQNSEPAQLKELCDDAFREIRSISNNLMPAVLTELGFFAAVKEHCSKLESFYAIQITCRYSELLTQYTFREGMDVNLYRMIQEFLHNTIKHADARMVTLVLLKEDEFLQLRYEDDGIGMEDDEPMPKVLQYRAELMGAILKRTHASQGLVYNVQIPLTRLFNEKI